MGQILRVADESQCAIVLIHHTAKGGGEQRSVVDAASGASAYARRADAVITLRDDPQGEMMMDIRSRSFPPVDRHCITWDATMRPNGEPITAATMADVAPVGRRNKSRV
jgi:RecA-family ATPase